jgi:hypothetical protein
MRWIALLLVLGAWVPAGSSGRVVTIAADADATLIEDAAGAWANGTGPLFVGRNNQPANYRRRAVLRFDVDGALPTGAIVESVDLTLVLNPSNPGRVITVHRLLADWTEGPTFGGGGNGNPSQPGDVTWIHTTASADKWSESGGTYDARVSATAIATDTDRPTWTDKQLVADVRLWQRAPERNFGWILIGDETRPQNAQSFASREDTDPERRPRLTIRYRLPGLW